jgi:predicted methyltransferase
MKPFVFLDAFDTPAAKAPAFGIHPHSGLATLTYLIDGRFSYEDTTGKSGLLYEGGLEWMRAGGGVWHTGAPATDGRIRGFQLWVALPADWELRQVGGVVVEQIIRPTGLLDPRVEVVSDDAFTWLDAHPAQFDFVVIDFPDPSNYHVGKLYTSAFYRLVKQHLAPGAFIAVQSTSPMFARQSYWSIVTTLEGAGLRARCQAARRRRCRWVGGLRGARMHACMHGPCPHARDL